MPWPIIAAAGASLLGGLFQAEANRKAKQKEEISKAYEKMASSAQGKAQMENQALQNLMDVYSRALPHV